MFSCPQCSCLLESSSSHDLNTNVEMTHKQGAISQRLTPKRPFMPLSISVTEYGARLLIDWITRSENVQKVAESWNEPRSGRSQPVIDELFARNDCLHPSKYDNDCKQNRDGDTYELWNCVLSLSRVSGEKHSDFRLRELQENRNKIGSVLDAITYVENIREYNIVNIGEKMVREGFEWSLLTDKKGLKYTVNFRNNVQVLDDKVRQTERFDILTEP